MGLRRKNEKPKKKAPAAKPKPKARAAGKKRTQEQRAKAVGITGRTWRSYMKTDPDFAQLVGTKGTDEELTRYIECKANGLKFTRHDRQAPAEDDGSEAEGATLSEVMRRTKIARMRREEESAIKAEIERKVIEGSLIEIGVITAEYGRAMTKLKNTILAVGSEINNDLLKYVDTPAEASEIQQLITEACRNALDAAAESLL